MALFTSYAPPGVYTTEVFVANTATLAGTARIPVIIGEGQQYFTISNYELFRGSSPVQDDQSVNENISDQVTGLTQSFNTTFYPVTDGAGKGTVTNDPSKVQVQAIYPNGNVVPVTVVQLNGATGAFLTQEIIPAGTDLTISYFFKRGDTLITNEDHSADIPSYATLTVGTAPNQVVLSLSTPGATGNLVTLQFISGAAVPDAQAVNGAGTDAITININSNGSPSTRTLQSLVNLVSAGIPTLDGGYLTVKSTAGNLATALTATSAAPFAGGIGQGSNTLFVVNNFPITDGSNGGVTTTNPANVTAEVNGVAVAVAAVNGALGQITLANPVAYGSTLTFTYYYNTWQNTYDLLPSANVASIVQVGLGPNRSDFTQGVDYSLGVALDSHGNVVANTVNWGNNVTETIGSSSAGELANFTPSEVLTTLVDDKVYLRPCAGVVNGRNAVFTLPDTPTDGSGSGRITDNPNLVQVYVGSDPLTAFESGAVAVASLNGLLQQVTLFNPPQPSSGTSTQPLEPVGVWASYYRNDLASHQYTVSVVQPGFVGLGTYQIKDELGRIAPLVYGGTNSVAGAGFTVSGVLYPNTVSFASPYQTGDAQADAGAAVDETVKLIFRNDGVSSITPAVQASKAFTFGAGTLTFTATTPGVSGNNVQIAVDASDTNPVPVVVSGDLVTIYSSFNGTPLTLAQIAGLFPSAETVSGGQILCAASGTVTGNASTTAPTNLTGGTDAVTTPITHSYAVTSAAGIAITNIAITSNVLTVTASNSYAAGTSVTLSGLTTATFLNGATVVVSASGGTTFTAPYTHADYASAPDTGTAYAAATSGSGSGTGSIGYLNQTYEDSITGFRVTVVNPTDHVEYGIPSLPGGGSYTFAPGDVLQYIVKVDATGGNAATRACGTPGIAPAYSNNAIAIPGLNMEVVSNFNSTTGDTVIVSTVRASGDGPTIGTFYYVTFTTNKTANDYALKLYTRASDAYAQYGQPSQVNRLSLGIQLMTQNGVQTFGAIQVPVVPGTNVASSADYIAALAQLTQNLPGLTRKADVVVPLSNDPTVHQALSRQLTTQASARYKGEAIGFVGYNQFATPAQMSSNANSLLNQRMIAMGNPAAGILITNPTTGIAVEYLVDGPFIAAAMAGLNCNPANDVATTLTNQNLTGFSRLLVTFDDPTMDLMAANGLTLVLNNNGALLIRHYKTTDPSNVLVSEPTSTTIADYVSQQFRLTLAQFIGRKIVDGLTTDIQVVSNSLLKNLVDKQIISAYQNLVVVQNPNDPTEIDVTVTFQPIFSLLYLSVTFTVQTSL